MAFLKAKISGMDAVLKNFKAFGKEGEKEFEAITKIKALDIVRLAQTKAPVNKQTYGGTLKQGIIQRQITKLSYEVVATAPYSAFQEFGTGTRVSIPKGWEAMADEFRAKPPKRKVNIPPKPFLYPAFRDGGKLYLKDLDEALERLSKKYSK